MSKRKDTHASGSDAPVDDSLELLLTGDNAVLLELTQEGVCRISPQGVIEGVNPAYCRITGYSRRRLVGASLYRLLHETDRRKVAQVIARPAAQRSGPYLIRHRHRDGSWLSFDATLKFVDDDETASWFINFHDQTDRKRAESELRTRETRYQEERLGRVLDHSPNEIYVFANDSLKFLQANKGACDNLGYSAEEMNALTPVDIAPSFTRERFVELLQPLRDGNREQLTFETIHYRKNGTHYPVEIRLQLAHEEYPPVFVAIVQDSTERKRAETQMSKLSGAVEQTADAVMITDSQGEIEYVNAAFETISGYGRGEAVGSKPSLIKSGMHDAAFYRRMWSVLRRGGVFQDVLINRRKSGELYYEEKTITPLKNENGRITHYISTGKDITDRMETQERLHHLAYHDLLTGLPNRAMLSDRLQHALTRASRARERLAVLILDLDRFKVINDTLGHDIGDRLLRAIAARVQSCVRDSDTLARLGGDEFAVLLEDVTGAGQISAVATEILDQFARPVVVEEHELFVTPSIGIGIYPDDGDDMLSILKNADTAMFRAKEHGGNTYQFYASDMGAKALQRLTLETGLRRALARNEFVLHYQPQFDLHTGDITTIEALVRWQHPDLGLVPPADFMRLLEETGLIVPIGEWVLQTACVQNKIWQDQCRGLLRIAINVSPRQFRHGSDLVQLVANALKKSGLEGRHLELELTESTVMENVQAAVDTMDALSAMGVRIAIDDFGTGYSSLNHLKRFPISTLKVDRSFVQDITRDPDDAAMVSTIAAMGHHLMLQVVAEGVESEAQLDFLRKCDCDVVQGYLLGRPLSAEEMTDFLTANLAGPIR